MTRTYNFNDRAGQYIGRYLFGHISPAAAAREMFKPSTDSASILVPSRKIFSFGLEVILGGRHKCFFFDVFMAYFTRPWTPIEWPNILTQVFMQTRLPYEFFETLIGFLAYLDQKICHRLVFQPRMQPNFEPQFRPIA